MVDPLASGCNWTDDPEINMTFLDVNKNEPLPFFPILSADPSDTQLELSKLKNRHFTDLDDPLLKQELEELLGKENKIDQSLQDIQENIENLKKGGKDQKFFQATAAAQRSIHDYALLSKDISEGILSPETFNLLNKVFPSTIMHRFGDFFDNFHTIMNLTDPLLHGIDITATGTIIICRAKLLKEAKKTLKTIQENVQANQIILSPEDQKLLKEWEANIKVEDKTLAYDALKYSIRSTKRVLASIRIISRFVPADSPLVKSTGALPILGWVASSIVVVLSAISLKKLASGYSFYKKWEKELEHLTPSVNLEEGHPLRSKYEPGFNQILANLKDSSKEETFTIQPYLAKFGIKLPGSIKQRGDLLKALEEAEKKEEFREFLLGQYIYHQERQDNQAKIVQDSQRLLKKREIQFNKQCEQVKLDPILSNKAKKFAESRRQEQENLKTTLKTLEENLSSNKIDNLAACEQLKKMGVIIPNTVQTKEDYLVLIANKQTQITEWLNSFDNQVKSNPNFTVKFYVENQHTLSQIIKTNLQSLVDKKHKLEKNFLKFKLFESSTLFTILAISLAVSATIVILGLSLTPIGPPILLALTILSAVVSIGFSIGGEYLSYRKKPGLWKADINKIELQTKITRVTSGIQEFSRRSKYKKLKKLAIHIREVQHQQLPSDPVKQKKKIDKLIHQYEKARKDYFIQCEKVQKWNQKVEDLQTQLLAKYWEDFSQHAKLSDQFDTLQAFTEAFQNIDPQLLNLDNETKYFLEKYLNIDIAAIQEIMKTDPKILEKSLQKFFSFSDTDLLLHIRRQHAYSLATHNKINENE